MLIFIIHSPTTIFKMKIKYYSLLIFFIVSLFVHNGTTAQSVRTNPALDSIMPVRGFCIAAPAVKEVNRFVKFINEELASRKVNTLILRVDYNYAYESHPELRDNNPLSKNDVKQLVNACKQNHIRLIPQVNLLGHQSWANKNGKLLEVYPDFDETPYVKNAC
jgi:hypothetical protein